MLRNSALTLCHYLRICETLRGLYGLYRARVRIEQPESEHYKMS